MKKSDLVKNGRVLLRKLRPHPDNPRKHTRKGIEKLAEKIRKLEVMMEVREIVFDLDSGYLLAGHGKTKALRHLGYKDIPAAWVDFVSGWTEEEKRKFMVFDNVHEGMWDDDVIAEKWKDEPIEQWGAPVRKKSERKNKDTDYPFAEELDLASNYVVLRFNTDVDWLFVRGLFGLHVAYSKRSTGEKWNKSMGRVVDGMEGLRRMEEWVLQKHGIKSRDEEE